MLRPQSGGARPQSREMPKVRLISEICFSGEGGEHTAAGQADSDILFSRLFPRKFS